MNVSELSRIDLNGRLSVDALAADMRAPSTNSLEELREQLRQVLPVAIVEELCASPCALRAGLLGLERGQNFAWHERRVRLPIAPGLEPEVPVWEHGEQISVWREGILQEPKYYSFFLDAPLPIFNPNYRGKWRSHELLHGAVGLCWRPDFTRFEAYLSARIAETLPVVHWYGWDEMWRQRCPEHHHTTSPPLLACAACEASARQAAFWEVSWQDEDHEHARQMAACAVRHFEQEWQAITRELRSGRRHETLYQNLNASRDAIGYVHSHWPRMTGWSFGAWMELFMKPGEDYHTDLPGYALAMLGHSERLLASELPTLSPSAHKHRRARRAIQDLGYRVLYALEFLDEQRRGQLFKALSPALEQCAAIRLDADHTTRHEAVTALLERLGGVSADMPEGMADVISAVGHDFFDVSLPGEAHERAQLLEGLSSGGETLMYALEGAEIEPHEFFDGFESSAAFAETGMLTQRAARWLVDRGEPDFGELLGFEAFLYQTPRRDQDAEAFAMLWTTVQEVLAAPQGLRVHATLVRGSWRAAMLEAVFEEPYAEDPEQVCEVFRVVTPDGELRCDLYDEAERAILDALAGAGDRSKSVEGLSVVALERLLEVGVLWWSGA